MTTTPAMPELPDGATVLPDGSAFAIASFPLPSDHWLYAPREYRDGEEEPIELPSPILSHQAHGDIVRAAIRYAVRSATMCGKEPDFDPDALVQNAMYALCGPFGGATLQAQPAEVSDAEIERLQSLRPQSEPDELSPDFTDTARAALLWVLWHHQGGSSPVGQPIRYALGMGAHESLNAWQVSEAKRWAAITGSQTGEFRGMRSPQAVPMTPAERERELDRSPVDTSWEAGDAFMEGIYAAEAHHGITAPAGGEG